MAKENGFYGQLDKSKDKKGFCNCYSLAVFFVLIFALIEGLFYLEAKNIKYNPQEDGSYSIATGSIQNPSAIDLGSNAVRVSLTQGFICQQLSQVNSLKDKKIACLISADGVEISGKISAVLPSNAKTILIPKALDGELKVSIKKATIGSFGLPSSLFSGFSAKIESSLATSESLKGVSVEKVDLQDGVMIVEGTKK